MVHGGRVVRCRTLRSQSGGIKFHPRLLCTNANSACQGNFDDIWQKYSKDCTIEYYRVCMLQFSCRFIFINFSSFKPDTKNNTNFDVDQANVPTLTRCNFFKYILKLIIFGTHNLQTFKHNTLSF